MNKIMLNGKWDLFDATEPKKVHSANVPGNVHTDLLKNRVIEDPFFRDNELKVLWIEDKEWVYSRAFNVDKSILAEKRVMLRAKGLDTLAEIYINGKSIGDTDNMFRCWEFDVKKILRPDKNSIEIRFKPVFPYLEEKKKAMKWEFSNHQSRVGYNTRDNGNWLRKEPCNFGWDWGPRLVTCGIWKDIEIISFSDARLTDVLVLQEHKKGSVKLSLSAKFEKASNKKYEAVFNISFNGKKIASETILFSGEKAKTSITINNPELWWPNNMGEQNLYDVEVLLLSDKVIDSKAIRIGLRKLELVRKKDKFGESFYFSANGVPFFSKGANWIPMETFITAVTEGKYRFLIKSTKDANMNMLRVWGGGIYENDEFYSLCDEYGICVWQDLIFACHSYPIFDKALVENARIEVAENVKRLRHHPCIALWCGNNEIEQCGKVGEKWEQDKMKAEDYYKFFDEILQKTIAKVDTERPYWPSSPHSPLGDRKNTCDPASGDAHLWSVWHGKQPFEWYRETTPCRFVSEFGFQSFAEPKTVRSFTVPEDRNITSWVMDHHQRAPIGNSAIMGYMLDWLRMPKDFESLIWSSQILQGLAIKYAVEFWRKSPQCMGALYWQLNDCWPVASWASIDYNNRWKALQYTAKKFFNPLLVTIEEDWKKNNADFFTVNDSVKDFNGELHILLTDLDGKILDQVKEKVSLKSGKSKKAASRDFSKFAKSLHGKNLMIWAELYDNEGKLCSENMASFYKPKSMDLRTPEIEASVRKKGPGTFSVSLKTMKPAMWVWLELENVDTVFSDNFFHMRPGREVEIEFHAGNLNEKEVKKLLLVRSLKDIYTDAT
ncbi:MAG: hypothetical protein A2020_13370 [Lentisphaerae bacterium GWF2_45_14]|nr:MAG: hypothetical protein A2020_13370 [Lentisphaerae bacterium GWF2_45_14]